MRRMAASRPRPAQNLAAAPVMPPPASGGPLLSGWIPHSTQEVPLRVSALMPQATAESAPAVQVAQLLAAMATTPPPIGPPAPTPSSSAPVATAPAGGGCPPGTAFNAMTGQCLPTANVPGSPQDLAARIATLASAAATPPPVSFVPPRAPLTLPPAMVGQVPSPAGAALLASLVATQQAKGRAASAPAWSPPGAMPADLAPPRPPYESQMTGTPGPGATGDQAPAVVGKYLPGAAQGWGSLSDEDRRNAIAVALAAAGADLAA
jgi:hypothetical protein